MEATQMFMDRWIDREAVVHVWSGVLLSHKKEWNAICSHIDGLGNYHTKWSKSERESQIPDDITSLWNLKYDKNGPIYATGTLTDMESGLVVARGKERRGGTEGVWGLQMQLLYAERINSKALLHSTGNYIQYPGIKPYWKRIFKRMYVCV